MMRLFYFFWVLLIAACSSGGGGLCHVNGNLDYLETDSLRKISSEDGKVVLSDMENEYTIPNVTDDDKDLKVGKDLNICPPSAVY